MKLFAALILSICTLTNQAQSWERIIADSTGCCSMASSVKKQGNTLYVLENSGSPNTVSLRRFSLAGEELGRVTVSSETNFGELYGESMVFRSANELYITGFYKDTTWKVTRGIFLKLDSLGEFQLITGVNPPKMDLNYQLEYIDTTRNGGLISCGFANEDDGEGNDFFVVRSSSFGQSEWRKTYDFGSNEVAHSVHPTTDGGFIISGDAKEIGSNSYDNMLLKLDSAGNKEWELRIGDSGNNGNQALLIHSSGDFILCGEGSGKTPEFDVFLARVSPQGELKWIKNLGASGSDAGFDIVEKSPNELLITGYSTSYSGAGPNNVFLASIDAEGNSNGVKYFSRPGISIGYSLVLDADTAYIAGVSDQRLYLIRTGNKDYTDQFTTTPLSVFENDLSGTIQLFPNPSNGVFTLTSEEAAFHYRITDISGKELLTGFSNTNSALIRTGLPSGTYLLRTDFGTRVIVIR